MEDSGREPEAVVFIGLPDPRPIRMSDEYGEEVDRWVLEEERPYEGSAFQRLHPGEIDSAVRSLRDNVVTFGSKPVEMNGQRLVSIADIGPGEATIATYGPEGLGEGYRLSEIEKQQVPEDVQEMFSDSWMDELPFRDQEFLELFYVEDRDHEYNLEELTGSRIDEAQRAMNGIDEKIKEGEYSDHAFGYSSGFLL